MTSALDDFHTALSCFIGDLIEYTETEKPHLHPVVVQQKCLYDASLMIPGDDDTTSPREKIMVEFHEQMSPYFDSVDSKDLKFIKSVKFVTKLGLDEILEDADQETKDALFQHIELLVAHARMWHTQQSGFPAEAAQQVAASLQTLQPLMGSMQDGTQPAIEPAEMMNQLNGLMSLMQKPEFQEMMRGAVKVMGAAPPPSPN